METNSFTLSPLLPDADYEIDWMLKVNYLLVVYLLISFCVLSLVEDKALYESWLGA